MPLPIRAIRHSCLTAALFCLGLAVAPLHAQTTVAPEALPDTVTSALRAAQIPLANVAVVVQPVETRSPLISVNGQQAMNPASVMKLVTTYSALEQLGPAFTWQTTAWSESDAQNGRLNGNLYLKGGGDPKFAMEHFWLMLRQLRLRGVKDIAGDLVLDRSLFSIPTQDPGEFDDKPLRPYNVGPDPLLVNFRAQRLIFSVKNGSLNILNETPSDGLRIDNRVTVTSDSCGEWKDRLNVRPLADGNGGRLEISGAFSAACGDKVLNMAALPADTQVNGMFRALWKELGGTIGGQVRAGRVPGNAVQLAEQESPSLAEVVRDINKYSNNVMARQLFITLGTQPGSPSTLELARQRVVQWLGGKGLSFPELVIENGSGLSRRERISAQSLTRMLQDAWRSPVMPEFISSMPIVGVDGTMKKRLKQGSAAGRAHIKTGTLDGVKTAAGYALDGQGRSYTYVFFVNHPRAATAQGAMDALLTWISQR